MPSEEDLIVGVAIGGGGAVCDPILAYVLAAMLR